MLLSSGHLLAELDVKTPRVKVIEAGGSDQAVHPPRPTCDQPIFTTELVFDADGYVTEASHPRFGTSAELLQVLDVANFTSVGPGSFSLTEVITLDGHRHRATWPDQLNEQVWFEFLLGGVSQGRSALTPDVPDDLRTGWMVADMGVVDLPDGADTLRIHHAGINPAEVNSLVLYGLCGGFTPTPTTTTTELPKEPRRPTTTNTQELTTTSIARRQTTSTLTSEAPTTRPPTTKTTEPSSTTATTEAATSTTATTEPSSSTTPTESTEPPTSTTATTEPPTSTTATTEPPASTTPEDSTSTTSIEPEVQGQVELADTGIDGDVLASIGLITILVGLGLVAIGQAMAPTTVAHAARVEMADTAEPSSIRKTFGLLALTALVAGIVVVSKGRSAR